MEDSLLADIGSEFETDFTDGEPTAGSSTSNDLSTYQKPSPMKAGVTEANQPGPEKPKIPNQTQNLLVNQKQRGNPLLKSVRNVTWEYDDIVPDYQMSPTTCALFLSLRYHNLNPDYIHNRLKLLGQMYTLRVLLVLVDIKDPHHVLKNLTRICILADLTLILAWSSEEAGKTIETYKIYENKPADVIKEKGESSSYFRLIQALTTIKPINKSDAMSLIERFKTLKAIVQASEYQIADLPGFGIKKAKILYNTLHTNFCK